MSRCEATTERGRPCQRPAVPLSRFCRQHTTPAGLLSKEKMRGIVAATKERLFEPPDIPARGHRCPNLDEQEKRS